jgi:hypothetical protein
LAQLKSSFTSLRETKTLLIKSTSACRHLSSLWWPVVRLQRATKWVSMSSLTSTCSSCVERI